MNSVEFLTVNEFEKLKSNLELTEQERFILEHMRRNDLTNEGMALELNISSHKFKQIKASLKMKIYKQACK